MFPLSPLKLQGFVFPLSLFVFSLFSSCTSSSGDLQTMKASLNTASKALSGIADTAAAINAKVLEAQEHLNLDFGTRLAAMEAYEAQCGGGATNLATPVMSIAKNLEAQKLAYISSKLQDCSGMFHQVLIKLKEQCPEHSYPEVNKYRDSRSLAKWFHENEKLVLVNDAKGQSDLIKPGAAMFYGYGGRNYSNFKAEDLFVRGSGINHVGVVVDVQKDEAGNVTSYSIFHGRNPKYTAGITDYHELVPTRSSYPPLGNGPEQWVAVAPIIWD